MPSRYVVFGMLALAFGMLALAPDSAAAQPSNQSLSVSNITQTQATLRWSFTADAGDYNNRAYVRVRFGRSDSSCRFDGAPQTLYQTSFAGEGSRISGSYTATSLSHATWYCIHAYNSTYVSCCTERTSSGRRVFRTLDYPREAADYSYAHLPPGYWFERFTPSNDTDAQGVVFGFLPLPSAELLANDALSVSLNLAAFGIMPASTVGLYGCGGADFPIGDAVDVCIGSATYATLYNKSVSAKARITQLNNNKNTDSPYSIVISGVPPPDSDDEAIWTRERADAQAAYAHGSLSLYATLPSAGDYLQVRFDDGERIYNFAETNGVASAIIPLSDIYSEIPTSYQTRGAAVSYASRRSLAVAGGGSYSLQPYSWAYTPWTTSQPIFVSESPEALPEAPSRGRFGDAIEDTVGNLPGGNELDAAQFTPVVWAAIALAVGAVVATATSAGMSGVNAIALSAGAFVAMAIWSVGGPEFAGLDYRLAYLPMIPVAVVGCLAFATRLRGG